VEGEKRRKTEIIKERAIYVYLLSEEMVKAWKRRGEEQGGSISRVCYRACRKFATTRRRSHIQAQRGN